MMLTTHQLDELRILEEGLWRPETRSDRAWLEEVLSPEFTEFCRFGHVYDRNHLLEAPLSDLSVDFPFDDFSADLLAPNVALVTYENTVTSKSGTETARRSSIWIHDGVGWSLRFQQATTLPDQT